MTGTLGLFREEGLKTKEEAGPTPHAIETQKEASQLVAVSRSRRELRLSHILGGSPRFALLARGLQKTDSTLSAILPCSD